MASDAQTDRREEARRDGDGSAPRRPVPAGAPPSERLPVDRVEHPEAHAVAVARPEFTETEQRLLADLFARVEDAFLFACEHHADQRRRSGEDFIVHPVGVAKICAGLRLDTETLCAALLHDTVEDTSAS